MARIVGSITLIFEGDASPDFMGGHKNNSLDRNEGVRVNVALAGEKLYLLNDLQEIRAERVMDLGFTSLTIINPSLGAVGFSPNAGQQAAIMQGIVPVPDSFCSKRHQNQEGIPRF